MTYLSITSISCSEPSSNSGSFNSNSSSSCTNHKEHAVYGNQYNNKMCFRIRLYTIYPVQNIYYLSHALNYKKWA